MYRRVLCVLKHVYSALCKMYSVLYIGVYCVPSVSYRMCSVQCIKCIKCIQMYCIRCIVYSVQFGTGKMMKPSFVFVSPKSVVIMIHLRTKYSLYLQ